MFPTHLALSGRERSSAKNLYEDAKIRILRCTFKPGDVHVRHMHPAVFGYVLTGGGKAQVADDKGTRTFDEDPDGSTWTSGPVPWHEFTNIGTTPIRYLVVEKKYE